MYRRIDITIIFTFWYDLLLLMWKYLWVRISLVCHCYAVNCSTRTTNRISFLIFDGYSNLAWSKCSNWCHDVSDVCNKLSSTESMSRDSVVNCDDPMQFQSSFCKLVSNAIYMFFWFWCNVYFKNEHNKNSWLATALVISYPQPHLHVLALSFIHSAIRSRHGFLAFILSIHTDCRSHWISSW